MIVAIILGALVLCSGVGAGGYLFLKSRGGKVVPGGTTTTVEPTGTAGPAGAQGFDTPEEAVASILPQSDWVFRLNNETTDSKEYWIGPPASEFSDVVIVRRIDGKWVAGDPMSLGSEGGAAGDGGDAQQAQATVESFLKAVMDDRPEVAHALTVEPFASDGASAQYGNGDFLSYTVDNVLEVGDGTYAIDVTETWRTSTDTWRYHVVPTEGGWRIDGLGPTP